MKKILYLIKLCIKILIRFVFSCITGGENCLICGTRTIVYPVCSRCRTSKLSPPLEVERCRICGKELLSTNDTCFQCREKPVVQSLNKVLPLFPYRIWNKELMFMWKSQEIRSLSIMFARILNHVLKQIGVEFIIPVPPRKGKIQEKGWDQIDELCNLLDYIYGFKILRLMERSTTLEQKKLGREGRLEQIGKAYHLASPSRIKKELKPYRNKLPDCVCLLDDVCTTGSTLESCAKVLKSAGIPSIFAVTLFTVD